jgi:hypothetical protein
MKGKCWCQTMLVQTACDLITHFLIKYYGIGTLEKHSDFCNLELAISMLYLQSVCGKLGS